METYRVARRDGGAVFWLRARNDIEARRFVALNVEGAERALDVNVFVCLMDRAEAPPVGEILCSDRASVEIRAL